MMIVHRGDDFICEYHPGRTDYAVVSFPSWRERPDIANENFGAGYLTRHKVACYLIRNRKNDWCQNYEFDRVIQAINGHRSAPLVGYGSSMGGYAALNFAPFFDFERIVAFCPQYSINAMKVPLETRWRSEAQPLDFTRDFMGMFRWKKPCYVLYDPFFKPDATHIDLIGKTFDLTRIRIPFSGHNPANALRQYHYISEAALALLDGRFSQAELLAKSRGGRMQSSEYFTNLSKALFLRGNRAGALRAAERAYRLTKDDFHVASHYGNMLLIAGAAGEAKPVFEAFLADPNYAGHAASWVERCRAALEAAV